MKLLRRLLRINKLDRERNQSVHCPGNTTESTKVAHHFLGTDSNRINKEAQQYEQKGRRNTRSLSKRRTDQLHADG